MHATAEGGAFDGVALVPWEDGAALVHSDRSGLYVTRVDASGRAVVPPRRVATPCPGGVTAAARGSELLVACLRPADRDRGREGIVVLLRVEGERAERIAVAAPAGAHSRGIDLAISGERAVVGWRDADVFTARARIAELRGETLDVRTLSSERTLASAPSLEFHEGALVTAWTESWFDPAGHPVGHLLVQREGAPPQPSLDVADVDVRVHLATDARGLLVTLRDRRPRTATHRAFTGRLDDRLRLTLGALHSPTRADAPESEPMLVPCGEHVFAIATRTSSRGVTMAIVRRLDAELETVEAEHQIYAYHARFPRAVGACVGGRLLLGVGERATQASPIPHLRTFGLRCGPGIAHERTPGLEGQVLRKRSAGPTL